MPGSVKEVNIKADMPAAGDAVRRLERHLHTCRVMGFAAVKVIHGYGSTGAGGKIRVAARRYLGELKRKGRVREVIPGEDFSIFDESTRRAFLACGDLRRDPDLDRHNNGVTIVIL